MTRAYSSDHMYVFEWHPDLQDWAEFDPIPLGVIDFREFDQLHRKQCKQDLINIVIQNQNSMKMAPAQYHQVPFLDRQTAIIDFQLVNGNWIREVYMFIESSELEEWIGEFPILPLGFNQTK